MLSDKHMPEIRVSSAKLTRNSRAQERGFGGGKQKRGPGNRKNRALEVRLPGRGTGRVKKKRSPAPPGRVVRWGIFRGAPHAQEQTLLLQDLCLMFKTGQGRAKILCPASFSRAWSAWRLFMRYQRLGR